MSSFENATVIVVHGAWADGSSWASVIRLLQAQGSKVIAAPIPLTSLSDDAAALKQTIARTEGPVIVAGHACAGDTILKQRTRFGVLRTPRLFQPAMPKLIRGSVR